MKDELGAIITDIVEVLANNNSVGLTDASADMILDCATRIYISNKISSERHGQQVVSKHNITSFSPADTYTGAVTEKQAFFLNKHGLNPAHFNKRTAHAKIAELMGTK